MKKGTRSLVQIKIIYVITTFFLVILSIYTFNQIKSLIDSSNWVNHTTLVTQSLHKISSAVFEAETNKRGYLLTGNKLLLDKKDSALANLAQEQIELNSLLKDNKAQSENLLFLNESIQKKVASINDISVTNAVSTINPLIKQNIAEGSTEMDSVMAHIDKMYGVETGLLQLRTEKYAKLSFVTPLYIIVLFLGALAILWASYIKINTALFHSQYLRSELSIQNGEKELKAATLVIANKELEFQNKEKERKAAELIIANKELEFQNKEKERKAAELIIANKELAFQNKEKERKAAELIVANKELALQNKEKEQKAAELIIANKELEFQNREKERKAAELIIANKELAFQNKEKEQRAAELIIANKELEFQNKEKEQRAAELVIANKELEFQNREKERKAKELVIANKELAFQNKEKEQRAAELVIANKELIFENEIKEQRATELTSVNEELRVFTQIASHDLQEPLRKIQMFASRILDNEFGNLSEKGKIHFEIIEDAATRMRTLIEDLITYSQTNNEDRVFEITDLNEIVEEVKADLDDTISEKQATIEINNLGSARIIPFQFRQLFNNLISNAVKFSNTGIPSHIIINSETKKGNELNEVTLLPEKDYCHISVSDNGIGFEEEYSEKIFEVFQRLHGKEKYKGTGIGLAIVKKIVENHNGVVKASSKPGKGARFDIYLPS